MPTFNVPGQSGKTIIKNVHIFDGDSFTDLRQVVIDGNVIGSDTEEVTDVIDGQEGFLIPGLIDAHVHVLNESHLNQLLQHGVTTAFDMGMWSADMIPCLRGPERSPGILTAGLPATKAGSVHSCVLPATEESLLTGPKEAEGWVQRRIEEGSDYIKIIADIPGPDQETMNVIVREAHQHRKMVVAHAATYKPFQMALNAKVDVVSHLPLDKAVDAEMAGRMVSEGTVAVPTLTMMEATSAKPPLRAVASLLLKPKVVSAVVKNRRNGSGKQSYSNAKDSITAMRAAGVEILAGTDCHDEPNSIFDVKHGESMHRELELLVEAGMSNVEVLRAATVGPASAFRLLDRGQIVEGQRADMVLLSQNPCQDIRATRRIRKVWCNGSEVERKQRVIM